MKPRTLNRRAFEKVEAALNSLRQYYSSQNVNYLHDAESALEIATKEDPEFLDAVYYSGITKDLVGKPVEASPYFNRILSDKRVSRKIKIEAEYNLGVAFYHQYSHVKLEAAEMHFKNVINKSKESNDKELQAMTFANLAQTYAMWMIPNSHQRKLRDTPEGLSQIRNHVAQKFEKFQECEKKVRECLSRSRGKGNSYKKIEAVIENAAGMALMYHTDYSDETREDKIEGLQRALAYLQKSDKIAPNDWANTCDLGSVHMRLGYHTEDKNQKDNYFKMAIDYLNNVLNVLRPDYGFAWYELGRIFRMQGNFEDSMENFNKALSIDVQYRDVDNETINLEKNRATEKDVSFP